jgi:hypothetical protein
MSQKRFERGGTQERKKSGLYVGATTATKFGTAEVGVACIGNRNVTKGWTGVGIMKDGCALALGLHLEPQQRLLRRGIAPSIQRQKDSFQTRIDPEEFQAPQRRSHRMSSRTEVG